MSGKPTVTKSTSFPPPVGGIDYVTPPNMMQPTTARDLLNYYVFDWGIRQTAAPTDKATLAGTVTCLFPLEYADTTLNRLIFFTATNMYRYIVDTGVVTDITPATPPTNADFNGHYFNDRLFFYNGVDVPLVYIPSTATSANGTWTGVTQSTLVFGWNYRNREYAIQVSTAIVWYAATVSAVAGTMTSVDYTDALLGAGTLIYGTSWPYNQGLTTEELFVLISATGEVLVYSGSYPAASNWQLVGRAFIPKPISARTITKLGDDILIGTTRGVISLKQVFAGRVEDAVYFNVSKSVNPLQLQNCQTAFNKNFPFLYWMNQSDRSVFVLNYERGAWSRINYSFDSNTYPTCLAWISNRLFYVQATGNHLIEVLDEATTSLAQTYTWKTPFFDFGSPLQKISKFIRVVGRNVNSTTSSDYVNSVTARNSFNETGPTNLATQTTAVTTNVYTEQQLAPPATGDRISYIFSKTGAGEINEINGIDVYYEEGGLF